MLNAQFSQTIKKDTFSHPLGVMFSHAGSSILLQRHYSGGEWKPNSSVSFKEDARNAQVSYSVKR